MAEQEQAQTKAQDYETQAEERSRNFYARSTAAVMGVVAGIATGMALLKHSLREYVRTRLFARDWTNGRLEEVIGNIRDNKADTFTGAVNDEAKIKEWAEEVIRGHIKRQGTLVGDPSANKAFKDLCDKRPPFFEAAINAFKEKVVEIAKDRDERLEAAKKKYPDHECEKFKEEKQKIDSNFIYYTDQAKKKHFDTPIFDEMIKAGDAPGRMGLSLRHAHNKKTIIAVSLVTTVAVGAVTYVGMKYLGRKKQQGEDEHPANAVLGEALRQPQTALGRV